MYTRHPWLCFWLTLAGGPLAARGGRADGVVVVHVQVEHIRVAVDDLAIRHHMEVSEFGELQVGSGGSGAGTGTQRSGAHPSLC